MDKYVTLKAFLAMTEIVLGLAEDARASEQTIRAVLEETGVCNQPKYEQVRARVIAQLNQTKAAVTEKVRKILADHGLSIPDDETI